MSHTITLKELLNHFYVLFPVLDGEKHYYVSDDEVEKLVRFGEGWLSGHPERELISQRFLKNQLGLVMEALTQIQAPVQEETGEETGMEQERRESPVRVDPGGISGLGPEDGRPERVQRRLRRHRPGSHRPGRPHPDDRAGTNRRGGSHREWTREEWLGEH